jgi:hypothetical protein
MHMLALPDVYGYAGMQCTRCTFMLHDARGSAGMQYSSETWYSRACVIVWYAVQQAHVGFARGA